MGQFTLGLRSLLIKSAVFVVMAALLAWALGGTLWPRPVQLTNLMGEIGGYRVHLRMTVQRDTSNSSGPLVTWELEFRKDRNSIGVDGQLPQRWAQVSGPIFHNGSLFVGKISVDPIQSDPPVWTISQIDSNLRTVSNHPMPDRLAVEQQLERLKAGLPLQDMETILRQRQAVLDPP